VLLSNKILNKNYIPHVVNISHKRCVSTKQNNAVGR